MTGDTITDANATTSIIKIDSRHTDAVGRYDQRRHHHNGTVAGARAAPSMSAAPSKISNASLNDGEVTVASGVVLTLDGDTVTNTTFADTASGATLAIDAGDTLTLSGVTIHGGTINDGTVAKPAARPAAPSRHRLRARSTAMPSLNDGGSMSTAA